MPVIINHVFVGPGPVKPADLFNILTWAALGHTVNVYVAHPGKLLTAEQHSYASLFNVSHDYKTGAVLSYESGHFFAKYKLVGDQYRGIADRVKLISLPHVVTHHADFVPAELRDLTMGWKTGILKFLNAMGDWWPNTEKVFTLVDATKFYLSATKQGLTCDMKVAPTRYFSKCEGELDTKFISFQRGNAGATGFENQLSGSMCPLPGAARIKYAKSGSSYGDGFGGKTVETAARAYEQITAQHGVAMQVLVPLNLGIDSTKMKGMPIAVTDPQSGWTGPVRVFKHPKDQTWKGQTLDDPTKLTAQSKIDEMAKEVLDNMRQGKAIFDKVPFDKELYDVMTEIRSFPNFNIYA